MQYESFGNTAFPVDKCRLSCARVAFDCAPHVARDDVGEDQHAQFRNLSDCNHTTNVAIVAVAKYSHIRNVLQHFQWFLRHQ